MSRSPIVVREDDAAFACVDGLSVGVPEFLADVMTLAEQLPDTRHCINLCEGRYAFTVAFFAAILRGQTNLLASRTSANVAHLRMTFGESSVVADDATLDPDYLVDIAAGTNGRMTGNAPTVHEDHDAAIVFTSGSTGDAQPHRKPWGLLAHFREVHWRYLPKDPQPRGLVATVPSWHMYGLEWAMLLPTRAPITIYCGHDFYPNDVLAALASVPQPSALVATPLHLKALVRAAAPAAPIATTLSATAPLGDELVESVERHLRTRIFEIYGCSEIGSLASRRPATDPYWTFFDCFQVALADEIVVATTELLPEPVTLADRFVEAQPGRFELLGRGSDIVKIAGKRESLAHLNLVLQAIAGIDDGLFYVPEDFGLTATGRLGALVVTDRLTAAQIRKQLTGKIDSAFLPRPIRYVDAMPRAATGKIVHADLEALLRQP